jgi:hypothetical protein
MNRADLSAHADTIPHEQRTGIAAGFRDQHYETVITSAPEPLSRTVRMTAERRLAGPVRLTLATDLGNDIDGAWWPHTGRISRELPELVSVLGPRLGDIITINVNWSSLESPPDLNWHGWRGKHQHVMTMCGRDARAKILVIPHLTRSALAVMVLRRAAGLPIDPVHHDSATFQTADCIVRVARGESC